jgi:hypothetical protein
VRGNRLDEKLTALTTFSAAQLRQEWERVHRAPAPANFVADLLARGIAYTLQERAFGGLSAATRRQLAGRRDGQVERPQAAAPKLRPGTRLAREWGGRTHHVIVTDHGFAYQEQSYRSLSQVAHLITGAKWSGPRFFGLNTRDTATEGRVRDVAA